MVGINRQGRMGDKFWLKPVKKNLFYWLSEVINYLIWPLFLISWALAKKIFPVCCDHLRILRRTVYRRC